MMRSFVETTSHTAHDVLRKCSHFSFSPSSFNIGKTLKTLDFIVNTHEMQFCFLYGNWSERGVTRKDHSTLSFICEEKE